MTLFLCANAYSQEADAIVGQWLTDGGESLVEIYKCDDRYCGKIVWLMDPKNEDGTDKVDDNNPDKSKKKQKIIGLNIVWNFKHKGKSKWGDGKIYDPNNGKTYSCKMSIEGNKLKVRGYIGVSVLGRTTLWTGGLCRCDKK
ncbi:MAG: DUF2147 domain-containing protein [Desulfobacterales bacterium]|nr:DUF2147 domain-containing protein [Desulfobacterales bacterium]